MRARAIVSRRVRFVGVGLTAAATLLVILACQETDLSTFPSEEMPDFLIVDAAHELGNADFFFLPPLVPSPEGHPEFDPGAFDASLSPVVEICELTEVEPDVLECVEGQPEVAYSMASGLGSEVIRMCDTDVDQYYLVNWHTDESDLDPTKTYRIQVFVAEKRLGYADVDVVLSGKELKNVDTDQYIALKDGRTLPIKFRIQEGALRWVDENGGTAIGDDGAWTLEVPPGVLASDVQITATRMANPPPATNLLPGTAWSFGPEGQTFEPEAYLTISYGSHTQYPRLHKLADGEWVPVEGSVADLEAGTVTGPVTSFSEWAVLEGQLILTVGIQGGPGVVWVEGGEPSDPCGMGYGPPCHLGVDYEEPPLDVTLTAEAPGDDVQFEEWSEPGDGQTCGELPSCTVVMDADKEVVAFFSMPGVIELSETSASFTQPFGDPPDPASATITVGNGGGRPINAWTDVIEYTPDVDPWLEAVITDNEVEPGEEETLTLSILPNTLPIGDYDATVVLHDDGIFVTAVQVTLAVTAGNTPGTLTVHVAGGRGDVNSEGVTPSIACSYLDEPCEAVYPLGTEVTLVAEETYFPDGRFEEWSGTGADFACTTEPSCTFVMTGNRDVTAHFSMPGIVSVNPHEVSFAVLYGGEVVDITETVALENIGGRPSSLEPIEIYYGPNASNWLEATITNLTVEPGSIEFLTLTLNTGLATALNPGVYNATIPAFADGGQTGTAIQVTLTVEATGQQYLFDGTTVGRSGYLPVHLFTLADAATGNDIYPVGGTDNCATTPTPPCYLFSYFDTGADIVVITGPDAAALNIGTASDGNAHQDTRVRINGLAAVDAASLEAPLGPYGSTGGAQAEVLDVRVGPANVSNRYDPGATLIGAPVANEVLALINFTDVVTRGPYCEGTYCANLQAPNIQFFMPEDQVPDPGLVLQLERFGSTDPSLVDGATKGQKYFIRNVAFGHGQEVVTDDQTVDAPLAFFYDTGAPRTLINTELAAALGLQRSTNGRFTGGVEECWEEIPGNEGYAVDRITLFGATPGSGAYTIENAVVCVDERTTPEIRQMYDDPHTGTIRRVDAVIGTNLFMYLPILFDGPGNILGIVGQP